MFFFTSGRLYDDIKDSADAVFQFRDDKEAIELAISIIQDENALLRSEVDIMKKHIIELHKRGSE